MRITMGNCRLSFFVVLALLCLTPPLAFATVGPVHYYPADGNANDVAGSINGAIVGSVAFAPGKVGQAFSFTGSGYVDLTAGIGNFGVADFSIATWVKPDPTFTTTPIFVKRRPTSTGILNLLLQPNGLPISKCGTTTRTWGAADSHSSAPRTSKMVNGIIWRLFARDRRSFSSSTERRPPARRSLKGPPWISRARAIPLRPSPSAPAFRSAFSTAG